MNPQVDKYLIDGCMRCSFGGTQQCKVNNWQPELKLLRSVLQDTDLKEELKWGVPCYTFQGNNVLLLSALKDFVAVGFFKGSLLTDPKKVLVAPGENSQAVRQFRFTKVQEVIELEETIKSYVSEAIKIEKQGLKVMFKKDTEPLPQELKDVFAEDKEYKAAFEKLTPGRQRGYILYFSAPKNSETRSSRIEKCRDKVFSGKSLQGR